MSKTPYTRISLKEAEGISASTNGAAAHRCGTDHTSETIGANNPSIRLAMENLNRNYRNAVNPEDCADGSCDTVYIPFIILASEYNSDNYGTVGSAFVGPTTSNKYDIIIEGITQYNLAMAGGMPPGTEPGDSDHIHTNIIEDGQINDYTWHKNYAMQGYTKSYNLASDIRYYTGAQIYNEELDEFEDEFVSHRELRELFANIQFYLPQRIKTSHIINNFFMPSTGCQVNLLELLDFLGAGAGNTARQLLNQEYLHFAKDSPGFYKEDSQYLNQTFYTKLNVLQQIINGNTLSLGVSSKLVGQTGDWNNPELEGETWWRIMNHQGFENLGFSYFAMGFSASSYVPSNMWSANIDPYRSTGLTIKGPNSLPNRFFLHEFGHTTGRTHAWVVPVIAGSGALDWVSFSESGNIDQNTFFPGQGIMYADTLPTNTSILDKKVLNFDLKPPFAYNTENLLYKNIKRDSDKADEDYEYWTTLPQDRFASNNKSLSEIIEKYTERKTLLNNKLANTSNRKIGDFIELSDDERGYIEFVYNRFLPHYTRNFSVKIKFADGSSTEGGSKAQAIYPLTSYNQDNLNINRPSHAGALLSDITNGINSFWGGSYILKNPPAFGSLYQDGVVLNGSLGRKPIEQRYAYIIKVVALAATWDEAQAIPEEGGYFLPDGELLSELVNNGSEYSGGSNIGDNTDFHTNLYGDYTNVGGHTVKVWTTNEVNSTVAFAVSLSYDPNLSNAPTNSLKSSSFTAIHIKKVDLLEDNTIATQLVVNPTNDDGTRKGPDVTTRIPFCLLNRGNYFVAGGINPSYQDIADNIYYDPYWMHNFNAYNPAFPAYPDNTPVDNLLDPEFCPCLHTTQTYYNGDGNIYEFKIIGGGDNAWAAHAMIPGNVCKNDINEFKRYSNYSNPLDIQEVNSNDVSVTDQNKMVGVWLLYTTKRYKDGYDSPNLFTKNNITSVPLHTYDDPDQTVLTLPFFNGYCGFGWGTVLPIVYNIDRQTNAIYKNSDEAQVVSTEFNMLPTLYNWETELRLGYSTGAASTSSAQTTAQNMEQRYGLGQSSSTSYLYNPLYKFKSETVSYGKWKDVEGSRYRITAFDTEPKLHYYEDFYGTYDPFNLNDVMMYESIESVTRQSSMPRDWVKRINYHYNRNDIDLLENYKTIVEEDDQSTESTYSKSDFQVIIESIATLVRNFDLQSQVGGCNDPEAYNYNELATYDNGSCVERIYGCLQTWADNYKHHADGTLNTNINTDDGSCVGTVCANPMASGNYGAGYSTGLINNILEYSEQYDTQALIEAASILVDELDTSDNSNCQFTAIPRNTIIRLICTSRNELENLEVCNDNPIITYIRDKDTGDFYNYTSNPEIVQTPLLDLIWKRYEDTRTFENGVDKLILYNHINLKDRPWYSFFTSNDAIRTASDLPFPSDLEGERPMQKEIKVHIFGDPSLSHYNSTGQASYNFREKIKPARYNCIENPIIADGTGGCLLYTENSNANNDDLELKLGSCVVSDIQTITPYNCENQILFSPEDTGGYILDFSIFNTDEELQSLNPCASSLDTEPRYIIGGNLADNYSAIAQSNGIKVTYSQLPKYSGSQLSNLSGYSEDILDSNLIPNESRNAISFRSTSKYSVDETIATSSVLYTSISEYFYTIDGNPYSGSYVVKYNTTTNEIYYEIHSNTQRTSQSMNKLYTRVQVLELNSSLTSTYEETLSKKMHKVINKIINLPIFTDN